MRLSFRSLFTSIRPILVAVVLAVVIGAVLVIAAGGNPVAAYSAIATGSFGPAGWSTTLAIAIPVVVCAFAVSVPWRAGFLNLGGEGQIVCGGIAVVLVGIWLPGLPFPISIVVAIVAAAIFGGVVGFIPAIMETKLGIPLLVSSLLLSFPLVAIVSFLVRFPLLDPTAGLPQTKTLPVAFQMPSPGGINGGLLVVVALIVVITIADRATPGGFELRMTGHNRRFSAYSGVVVDRVALRSMIIGGALAGVAGALVVMSFPFRFIDGALISPQYVWTGLLAAMLARANPIGTVVAAVFFSALQAGGSAMQNATSVPAELSSVMQAIIIIILAGTLAVSERKKRKVG